MTIWAAASKEAQQAKRAVEKVKRAALPWVPFTIAHGMLCKSIICSCNLREHALGVAVDWMTINATALGARD